MEAALHAVPGLREIVRPTPFIGPETRVREVIDIFQGDASLLALPVVDGGRFTDTVNRRNLFFRHLGKPFARDLYGNKPISTLLDGQGTVMESGLDVNSALARLLEADPALETDSFAVVDNEKCHGIVPVADLMMQISGSQARLLDRLKGLSTRIREEVEKASKVQQDLLPLPEFKEDGLTISGGITTSSEIGGDLYDYFRLGGDRFGLVVADVSGHGVQSGMVTTAAKASLHTLIALGVRTPGELLAGMNGAILSTARQSLLMTCLVCIVDPGRDELMYANAGHNFPYRFAAEAGRLEMLDGISGFPLGFDAESAYPEHRLPFEPGDRLVLYTDGIVECTDPRGEEFGYARMEELLARHAAAAPAEVRTALLAAAAKFTGTDAFEDDVTLLIAARDGYSY